MRGSIHSAAQVMLDRLERELEREKDLPESNHTIIVIVIRCM